MQKGWQEDEKENFSKIQYHMEAADSDASGNPDGASGPGGYSGKYHPQCNS